MKRIRKIEYFALVRNEINWGNNWVLIRKNRIHRIILNGLVNVNG